MANLTRIFNNQITNSTIIASQKIAAGTITGSLFSSNITVPGDLLIAGNLFVLGTSAYTTIASTNTYVNDPLITLNNGFAGTNTYDEGLVFNRGSLQNRALIWSEYFQEFRLIGTTEAGTTYGNVVTSNFANLHIGNLIVDYTINHTGNFFTNGFINTTANISAAVGLFGAINSTGLINTTGNVSASQVSVATLNATGLINTLGNVSANTVSAYALSGIITTASQTNITAVGTLGSLNVTGNILATGAVVNALTVNGNESVTGYLNVTGNVLGSAGTLNTLNINSTTNTTGQSTGALQVAGGASFTQDVWIGGNLFVSNIIGVTANVITVQDPLLYLRPGNTSPYNYDIGFYSAFNGIGLGTINQYQHTSIFRDPLDNTWKFVSNLAEPSASYITIDATTIYDPIKAGNLNLVNTTASTTTGTGALIVAGGAGIAGTLVAAQLNSTGNVLGQAGTFNALTVNGNETVTGYINAAGNVSASQLIAATLSTRSAYGNIHLTQFASIFAQGNNSENQSIIQATSTGLSDGVGMWAFTGLDSRVYSSRGIAFATGLTMRDQDTPTGGVTLVAITATGDLWANSTTPASSTTTGAFVVKGGVGIGGNLYVGAGIQATAIGNVTAASGDFTRLAATETVYANATTDTTSLSTGALIVAGGTAVGKTLWVGEGAVINSTRAAEAFQVYGATGNNGLIYADTAKNAIVFSSTGNTTVQNGAITKFDSDGAIVLPVGATARRPGSAGNVDVMGMIRFNSTISNMEFYDGAAWQTAGSSFTVISDRQFSGNTAGGYGNVDGTNTSFTLQANSTTSGSIVSINGIMQFPTLAYSVSGTTLTFTEPPAPNDVIDVRLLTTTTTVSSVTSGNGLNQFTVDSLYANVQTGIALSTPRISVNTDGNISIPNGSPIIYNQSNVTAQGTNLRLLDSFSTATYGTAKYLVQIKDGANIESAEVLLAQDGVNVSITTYAVIAPGGVLGTFQSNISSGIVRWFYTPGISTYANIKVQTTYIV